MPGWDRISYYSGSGETHILLRIALAYILILLMNLATNINNCSVLATPWEYVFGPWWGRGRREPRRFVKMWGGRYSASLNVWEEATNSFLSTKGVAAERVSSNRQVKPSPFWLLQPHVFFHEITTLLSPRAYSNLLLYTKIITPNFVWVLGYRNVLKA